MRQIPTQPLLDRDELHEAIEYNNEQHYTKPAWKKIQGLIGADIDGRPGPQTAKKLALWQAQHDLEPDGWFGPKTRQVMGLILLEERELTHEEAEKVMHATGRFEGGKYDSVNRDGEYEGWFDTPKRDEDGRVLKPYERAQHEDHKPHWASKFGFNPGHVGLSYGKDQVTQKAGNLGLVLERAREYGGAEFYEVFGEHADELVEVTNRPGYPFEVMDEYNDGRRAPNTVHVAGYDVWEGYWVNRLCHAAQYEWMQRAQEEIFYEEYFLPALKEAKKLGLSGQDDLAVLYDICIQYGPGGMRKRTRKAVSKAKKNGEDLTIEHVVLELPRPRRPRRWAIIEMSEFWVTYTLFDTEEDGD